MIPYKTYSTLFQISPFKIEPWGLMIAIGILIALFIITKQEKKEKF